jgi:hypothetical protein
MEVQEQVGRAGAGWKAVIRMEGVKDRSRIKGQEQNKRACAGWKGMGRIKGRGKEGHVVTGTGREDRNRKGRSRKGGQEQEGQEQERHGVTG